LRKVPILPAAALMPDVHHNAPDEPDVNGAAPLALASVAARARRYVSFGEDVPLAAAKRDA
jgi:hypothetical protein